MLQKNVPQLLRHSYWKSKKLLKQLQTNAVDLALWDIEFHHNLQNNHYWQTVSKVITFSHSHSLNHHPCIKGAEAQQILANNPPKRITLYQQLAEINMPKPTFVLAITLLIVLFNASAGMGFAICSYKYFTWSLHAYI